MIDPHTQAPRWRNKLLIGALLLFVGAGAATWGLAKWQGAAQFFGIAPDDAMTSSESPAKVAKIVEDEDPVAALDAPTRETLGAADSDGDGDNNDLAARVARLERALDRGEGAAGRADNLLVAFAARRAIDRGVPLGYLEPMLVQRFGARHEAAVATIITAARNPVQLEQLIEEYQELGPSLRTGDPDEGWWDGFKRGLGEIVSIYPADQPNPRPQARYDRALVQLRLGEVDDALAETLRLPGIDTAHAWVEKARRYISTQRALDTIESAALLSREENGAS